MAKYLLTIDDDLWKKFKQTITRDRTINDVITEMIEEKVESYERKSR